MLPNDLSFAHEIHIIVLPLLNTSVFYCQTTRWDDHLRINPVRARYKALGRSLIGLFAVFPSRLRLSTHRSRHLKHYKERDFEWSSNKVASLR